MGQEKGNAHKFMENILEVRHLKVSFFTPSGEVKAVNDISYTLGKGEMIGIVGESGSGKSVSASAILGLVEKPGRVVGGSILFEGKDLLKLDRESMRKLRGKAISVIFQDPMTSLNPVYSIGTQIKESIRLYDGSTGKKAEARAIELLKMVSISEPERRLRQYPYEFSGGMRQRVMIAMALAGNPKLLIADEPTTALDVTIQAQILQILRDLRDSIGLSVMLISHDLGVVAEVADKVAVMYGGRIVESASAEKIFSHPTHPYTLGLLRSIPRLDSKAKLIPIPGSPIDLLNPPAGCPFAQRCGKCMRVCLFHIPSYTAIGDGHEVACWLLDSRAASVREGAQ